jgi:hypothetical protein
MPPLLPGAAVPLPDEHEERAAYVVDDEVGVGGDRFERGRMLIFRAGDRLALRAGPRGVRLLLLSGAAPDGQPSGLSLSTDAYLQCYVISGNCQKRWLCARHAKWRVDKRLLRDHLPGTAKLGRKVLQLRQTIPHRQHGFGIIDVNAGRELKRRNDRHEDIDEADRRMIGHQVAADLAPGAGVIEIAVAGSRHVWCAILFGAARPQGRRFASIRNDSGRAQKPVGCPVAGLRVRQTDRTDPRAGGW